MRIGIDAREMKNPYTGTGMYLLNLVKGLAGIDKINTYCLFVDDLTDGNGLDLPENFMYLKVPIFNNRKLQDQMGIVRCIRDSKIDVFHVIHHDVVPIFAKIPLIITVLDISWIDLPTKSKLFNLYYYYLTLFALKKAKRVITISESTKQRTSFYFPWSKNKTFAIPIACDLSYQNPEILDSKALSFIEEYKLNEDYVLYVGSFAKRKNLSLLLQAMTIVQEVFPKVKLILAGKPSGKEDTNFNEFDIKYKIEVISRPKQQNELKLLYNRAKMLVFPSMYEGFGLPVLEAMTCGCPVITSNTTSLPEIVGSAGIMIDPYNNQSLADNIIRVLKNPDLANDMIVKGSIQAKKFDWDNVAAKTLNRYKSVIK